MKKQRKNIDLSDKCINTLTIEAAKKKTKFKNLVEDRIEKWAKKIETNGVALS